jgi:hypothetical protein
VPKTEAGKRASALNRLRYGCEHTFLPCRRSNCVFADNCRRDPLTQENGFPPVGTPCALELREHEDFVDSAIELFSFARAWLDPIEYEHTIRRLSLLRIRWARISARITAEGPIARTEYADGRYMLREHVAFRRYWTSTQKEWTSLMDRLLTFPQDSA